jgi:hypothetical protein
MYHSYSITIIMFFVTDSIVRYICTLLFFNGTTIAKREFPLILFKNITKKRDVKEKVFHATQSTFITDLRTDIVEDLKKLTCSRTVVSIHRHWYA